MHEASASAQMQEQFFLEFAGLLVDLGGFM
jgi:hypothetical protein